ncbi:hypothetical protein Tco_1476593 [Tanacetum coccineum]
MSMSVQKSQVHKTATRSQDDDKRLCLVDDLKEVQVHIQVKSIRTSSSLNSKITMPYLQDEILHPGKFLIPYDFPELGKCMELADLGVSINLMPLSLWKQLMLPELIPTPMTLELANRSVAYPAVIAEDVCIQVVLHLLRILFSRSSPMNSLFLTHFHKEMRMITLILERFTDKLALVYSSPLGDDDDDDLFDFKSDNDECKKLLYGDLFNNTHSETEKDKDLKIESLIDDMDDEVFPLLLTTNLTLPEKSSESSKIATLLSSTFENEDKVFNPDMLILGGTHIFYDESKDTDLKVNSST